MLGHKALRRCPKPRKGVALDPVTLRRGFIDSLGPRDAANTARASPYFTKVLSIRAGSSAPPSAMKSEPVMKAASSEIR